MSLTTPTPEENQTLITTIESSFPSQTLGEDKWYILLVSALSAGGHPEFAADLYKYLIAKPEFSTSESRQALVRRLREALLKLVSVVGVPKPLEAIFSIAAVEKPEDRDYSFSREHWSSGSENLARGRAWLDQIYRHNHTATENVLAAHKDFDWLSREITYGLYLSDHTILEPVETELVVLSGIMMQNLKRETGWYESFLPPVSIWEGNADVECVRHLRGTRRIGVSYEDVETIQQLIEKVAEFCGLRLTRVPRVKDIEHEVAWES